MKLMQVIKLQKNTEWTVSKKVMILSFNLRNIQYFSSLMKIFHLLQTHIILQQISYFLMKLNVTFIIFLEHGKPASNEHK